MGNKKSVASTLHGNTNEEFLEHKKKKRWVNGSGHYCFMVYPRALFIFWAHRDYWDWKCFKETSEENIEVIKLSHVCRLDVKGRFKISDLSPGVVYEIAYVVKLTNAAFGWEFPIKLKLSLPGGQVKDREVSLFEKPKGKWIELKVGSFRATQGEPGDVSFDLYGQTPYWKHGLIIKGVIIRPKA